MTDSTARQDLLARIRASYGEMSASQQRVLEFFLTHGLEAVYLSAARIADTVDVSHSTVVRTAQALGFEGFPDFQAALQEQFLGQINSAGVYQLGARKLISEMVEQDTTNIGSILQRVMLTDAKNIENLVPQIPVADFEQAVHWLMDAPHVYVIGLRSSAPMALSFGMSLRQIRGSSTILQPGTGDLVDQVSALAENDVLFAICFGRYMKETLYVMEHARSVGARVITVTDTPVSPAARRADLVFTVRYGVWFYGASAALFSLLNAIIAALLVIQQDSAQERLEKIDRIIEQFGIFESGEE